jgi:hypothetical protein
MTDNHTAPRGNALKMVKVDTRLFGSVPQSPPLFAVTFHTKPGKRDIFIVLTVFFYGKVNTGATDTTRQNNLKNKVLTLSDSTKM